MMRLIGKAVWLITGLAALFYGLTVFNIDMMAHLPSSDNAVMIMKYIVGAAGLISLIMFGMHMFGCKCPGCHQHPCVCN